MDIKESDWKIFRKLREVALQRFSDRVLSEVRELIDTPKSAHERYLDIYEVIRNRNKELATTFDGLSRSRALMQLYSIGILKLLSPEEISEFSPEVQKSFPEVQD